MAHDPARPLEGIKVVELSTMITASLATMTLASQGAEVIKVEPLGFGDPMRLLGSQKAGISALFNNCNRSKRSIAIDIKSDAGRDVVRKLASEADVLVHNFRPGVMDRLGLGSEELRAENSRLIYLAISGFGNEGPLADAPAYDHIIQAMAGYTSLQGKGDEFTFMRTLICDKITAFIAAQGITAALLARKDSGTGQHLDISMLHASLAFLWPDGMMHHTLLDDDAIDLPPMSEYYQTLETSDGCIALTGMKDDYWDALCEIIGRIDLASDPRFADGVSRLMNMPELMSEFAKTSVAKDSETVLAELGELGVPCAPCLAQQDLPHHPQVKAIGAIEEQSHPLMGSLRMVSPPVRFGGSRSTLEGPSPSLGQHTRDILRELGWNNTAIHDLEAAGSI